MGLHLDTNTTKAPSTATAIQQVRKHVAHLHTLLRLIDPQSPFQPIVVGSIDLVAWLADFGTTGEALESSLLAAAAEGTRKSFEPLRSAAAPLFSISQIVCEAPRLHHSRPADYPIEELPGLEGLEPTSARSPKEQAIMSDAVEKATAFRQKANQQMSLLSKSLGVSIAKLKATLLGKHGLLRLMKNRSSRSAAFRDRFGDLAGQLEDSLTKLPESVDDPWSAHRRVLAQVDFILGEHLSPAMDEILRHTVPSKKPGTSQKQPAQRPPARQTIKDKTTRSIEAFREAYTLASNLDAAMQANQFWMLFSDLLEPVTARLIASDSNVTADTKPHSQRLIDAIGLVETQLLTKTVRADWDRLCDAKDDYVLEIIVAALHQLERSNDAAFGFSEEQLARWIRKGNYPGVSPSREQSRTTAAETKRVQRTLQKMRPSRAAFHDRRHWTPTLSKNPGSARHRLWTLNPLLAAHPWVRNRLATASATACEEHTDDTPQRTPSKRNRGPRKKR